MPNVNVVDHPLLAHKITALRDRNTSSAEFRRILREAAWIIGLEAMRSLPTVSKSIETPLERGDFPAVDEARIVFISILRAGEGMLQGLLDLAPGARVGHLGAARDEESLEPRQYYEKLPSRLSASSVFLIDPMLATAGTAIAAAAAAKAAGAAAPVFIGLVAAPEGVERLSAAHPDVRIVVGALDRELNAKGYIAPGLGDAGDRIFGTSD